MNTDNESKNKLQNIITTAPLTEAQKVVWDTFIGVATENEITPILDAIESDADALPFLTENLTAKMEAMRKKDSSLWGKIVQEEKAYLSSMTD